MADLCRRTWAATTTSGTITTFSLPGGGSDTGDIVTGPDGTLWFYDSYHSSIDDITTGGVITEHPTGSTPTDIVAGQGGNLWFTESNGNNIGTLPLATVSATFTISPSPAVSAVSPAAGSTAGGTTVTITGNYLSGATEVNFGSTAATSFTVNSATQITAVAPAESAGVVNITVTTPGGTSSTSSSDDFAFETAPTVTGISPPSGLTSGGASVTITGTNFTAATAVEFGGTQAISYTVNSPTQITAIAPAGSPGAVDVTVTTPVGTSATSTSDQFTYLAVPTVTAVSPAGGPLAGGTSVTITGITKGRDSPRNGPQPLFQRGC